MKKSDSKFLLWVLAGAASLVYAVSVLVPWQPGTVGADLGPSTFMLMHEVFLMRLQFGTQLVFPYGPLGFLYSGVFHPGTYSLMIVGRAFLAMMLWWTATQIGNRFITNLGLRIVWLMGVIAIAATSTDVQFAMLNMLALIYCFHIEGRDVPVTRVLLAVALAIAGLIKISFLIFALLVVAAVALDDLLKKRRAPWTPLAMCAALLSLWMILGQSIGGVWPYLRSSLELARGYDAMALDGPPGEVGWYLVFSATLVFTISNEEWRVRRWWGALVAAVLALFLLLEFKQGFVRHDAHALNATGTLAGAAVIYGVVGWASRPGTGRKTLIASCLAGCLGLIWFSFHQHGGSGLPAYLLDSANIAGHNLKAAVHIADTRQRLQQAYDEALQNIRRTMVFPQMNGDVDLYPHNSSVIFANGWSYAPRPVVLSHMTYTPLLQTLNADFVRDHGAPDLLFRVATIDSRYPTLDDGQSWPVLLSRYEVTGLRGAFLILKRSAQPRPISLKPLGNLETSFGVPAAMPTNGLIWATIDVQRTLLGRIATTVFKTPTVLLTVLTRGGNRQTFRLLPSLARAGFMLSPLIDNSPSFALMASKDWQRELQAMDITAFMITGASGNGGRPWFDSKVNVTFYQLDFPHQELPDVPGIKGMPARLANLRVLYSGVVRAAAGPQILTGPDGGPVLLARAPSQILLAVPVGAVKLHLGFGLMENAWKTGASEGVEFRVSKVTDDNHLILLWSRALDPVHHEEERAEQQAVIDLPPDAAPRLLLEALPRREGGGDHSYWSRATFDQLGISFDSASGEELATPH